MKTILLMLVLAACRPERIENPHTHQPRTEPQVQQDIGGQAPAESTVKATDGSDVDLTKTWADHKTVVVFYMGHWCPECTKQLTGLNDHQKDFAAKDTTVVAISTDSPEDAGKLKEKLGLTFDVYSDTQLQTIQKWGVANYDTNIAKPSTFIVQKGGAITFKKIGETTNDRPSAEQILAQLDQ
ncbi:MAG TPA: peroxiredoxin family protein [Kofleriaceae bacterium]